MLWLIHNQVPDRVVDGDASIVEAFMNQLYQIALQIPTADTVGRLYEDPEVDVRIAKRIESKARFAVGHRVLRLDGQLASGSDRDVLDLLEVG